MHLNQNCMRTGVEPGQIHNSANRSLAIEQALPDRMRGAQSDLHLCGCIPTPIWVKPNYKLQAIRPMVQFLAWPIGKSDIFYGEGLNPPITGAAGPPDEFLWLVFRKRACCAF